MVHDLGFVVKSGCEVLDPLGRLGAMETGCWRLGDIARSALTLEVLVCSPLAYRLLWSLIHNWGKLFLCLFQVIFLHLIHLFLSETRLILGPREMILGSIFECIEDLFVIIGLLC